MVAVGRIADTVPMTYARSQIAPPGEYGCFHVVTRCVRRAFLCGSDERTGKNFDHRRAWIEERIHFLAGSFAVSVYLYAVMSNHTHIVLSVDPQAVSGWTDEQVADRWLRVFPGAMAQASSDEQRQRVRMGLLSTPERMEEIRKRLGSFSWFMRALNEPIARMANEEDNCTRGRSIEARFSRYAETADFAFPTLVDSGRGGSNARPCWSRRRWFRRWQHRLRGACGFRAAKEARATCRHTCRSQSRSGQHCRDPGGIGLYVDQI